MNIHSHCLMCGDRNPLSLGLKFMPDEGRGVLASFRGNSFLQGYDGILHGGIISGLLDAAMAHCLFQQNITAVTGELNIRFIAPVPYNANLKLRAWLVSETPPLYELKAELVHDGKIMAQALSSIHENELMRVTTWLPFGSVNQLNVPQLRQSRFPCEYLLVLR